MFIINLIPLHVFVLLAMGRYSRRIYIGNTNKIWNGLLPFGAVRKKGLLLSPGKAYNLLTVHLITGQPVVIQTIHI